MVEHERRGFIPTGNCIDTDRTVFSTPATQALAKEACMRCLQLDYCTTQRDSIGKLLIERGEIQPVVGGEVVDTETLSLEATPIEQLGEVTLKFARHPLPADGNRALASIQQGFRAGQLNRRSLATANHPTFDSQKWALETAQAQSPDILNDVNPAIVEKIAREAGRHVILLCTRRWPSGKPYLDLEKRFKDFNPDQYTSFLLAYTAQAIEIANLGLAEPERLTTFHSPSYLEKFLATCNELGIPSFNVKNALKQSPAMPLEAAIKYRDLHKRIESDKSKATRHVNIARSAGVESFDAINNIFAVTPEVYRAIQTALQYRLITVNQDTRTLDLHERFAEYTTSERKAILEELGLISLVSEATKKALQSERPDPELRGQVFTTLLPHMHPATFPKDNDPSQLSEDIDLLMATFRRELWSGLIMTQKWQPDPIKEAEFLAAHPTQFGEAYRKLDVRKRLYRSLARLFEEKGLELTLDTATQFSQAFTQDVKSLIGLGVPDSFAPSLALYYSPGNYQTIVTYILRTSNAIDGQILGAFRHSLTNPLQRIRATQRRLKEWRRQLPSDHPFSDGNLRQLAVRNLSLKDLEEISNKINALQTIHAGKAGANFIRRLCVLYKGDVEDLSKIITHKNEELRRAIATYTSLPRETLAAIIIGAGVGQEKEAIERYIKRLSGLRTYFQTHPHPDVNDFVIHTKARSSYSIEIWLPPYEQSLATIRNLVGTHRSSPDLLRKIALTHTSNPAEAAQQFNTILQRFEHDPHVTVSLIEAAFHANFYVWRKRVHALRKRVITNPSLNTPGKTDRLEARIAKTQMTAEDSSILRLEVESLLSHLNPYEQAAVGYVFDLNLIAEYDEDHLPFIMAYFNARNEEELRQVVVSKILPTIRNISKS